jgi:hypothetical protein
MFYLVGEGMFLYFEKWARGKAFGGFSLGFTGIREEADMFKTREKAEKMVEVAQKWGVVAVIQEA